MILLKNNNKNSVSVADTNICRNFAAFYNVKGKREPAKNAGIFYALTILFITAAVTPVWSINVPTAFDWCRTTGKDSRFSVHNAKTFYNMATDLILSEETMSSLQIAELTGKAHSNVMRDIRNIIEQLEDKGAFKFELTSYTDRSNRQNSCYLLTKKDCLLLASGYNANLRAKIINRWEELELEKKNGSFQVPQSFAEALQLAADQAKCIEEQQKQIEAKQKVIEEKDGQIEAAKPAVAFTNAFSGAESSCLIGELAKIIAQNGYPIGEKRLFQWLRENGYLGKHGERYNVPNQQYIEQGLFKVKKGVRSGTGGVLHTTITTKVTGKGQVYFVNKFLTSAI